MGAACYHDGVQASEGGGVRGVYPVGTGNTVGKGCASWVLFLGMWISTHDLVLCKLFRELKKSSMKE